MKYLRLNSSMYTLLIWNTRIQLHLGLQKKTQGREVGWFHVMADPFMDSREK